MDKQWNIRHSEWDKLFEEMDSEGNGELSKTDLEMHLKVMIHWGKSVFIKNKFTNYVLE